MATRSVEEVLEAEEGHWVGDGFPVRTLFSYHRDPARTSPFLLLDYAGPATFPPSPVPRGVGKHPHRGFETVTIVYQGALEHRDSAGNHGRIGPGDVQWMTAGAGVVHEEMHAPEFSRTGGTFEVVQLWVNLPARHKAHPPRYQSLLAKDIPVVRLDGGGGGGAVRVIAGEYRRARGPAATFTPVGLFDLRLPAGGRATLEVPTGRTAALLVRSGAVLLSGTEVGAGRLALLSRDGDSFDLVSPAGAQALLLSGEPIDEPVVGHGPFVMNTQAEIDRALSDFRSGRFA
jgi:redox-sensitive bicupin YhaK (pirin superfamily)